MSNHISITKQSSPGSGSSYKSCLIWVCLVCKNVKRCPYEAKGLLLWILYVFYVSCLSCCLVCSLQPCGHLLGKGRALGSFVCDVFLCFCRFPYGFLGQVWYLIVSIPDVCLLPNFKELPSIQIPVSFILT